MVKNLLKAGAVITGGTILYVMGVCTMAAVYMYKGVEKACGKEDAIKFLKESMTIGRREIWGDKKK